MSEVLQDELDALQARLGYRFVSPERLRDALTHSSAVDSAGARPSERLEFLGDAVVGLVISELLWRRYPDHPEGDLSRFRAALVNKRSFAAQAVELGLDRCLLLGKGEEKTGGRYKASILADVFESVIGAVFLDGGFDVIRRILAGHFESLIEGVAEFETTDPKTELQELCQRISQETPAYRVIREEGPDHAREFAVEVLLGDAVLASGIGRSKRDAERRAAKAALDDQRDAIEARAP